jgi:hypothetical protein
MTLKDLILEKIFKYNFRVVKIQETNIDFLNLIKKNIKDTGNQKFLSKLKKIDKKYLTNFIFLLRCLDFRLWEFSENWEYKNENGFFGLMERLIVLFKNDYKRINFPTFKKIISPKENNSLIRLRFKIFKSSLNWLEKKFNGDFANYFEEYKNPCDFCTNLFSLKKFQDYYKNLFFLKPNQLLYLEFMISNALSKKFEDKLSELTIFADYKIVQAFLNFNLVSLPKKYQYKIQKKQVIKKQSILENELRLASIILGENLSKKLNLPSYLIDNLIWTLSHKIKLKIPHPRIKTIFY